MKYLLKLANLHVELAEDELRCFFNSNSIKKICNVLFQVDADLVTLNEYFKNSALLRNILHLTTAIPMDRLFDDKHDIFKDNLDNHVLPMRGSFKVQFKQLFKRDPSFPSMKVEGRLAFLIKQKLPQFNVNLGNPELEFYAYKFKNFLYGGWRYKKPDFEDLIARAPLNSPYFGGGAVKPHFSRILVNLLRPHDILIADPFCGHGGLLREVAAVGTTAIGFEISKKIAYQCLSNSKFHNLDHQMHVVIADALKLPVRNKSIRQFLSDPPYAIQTTTIGREPSKLLIYFLGSLTRGAEIVFSIPSEMLNKLPNDWSVLLDRSDYIHKSLTRRVRKVIKK